MSAKPNTPNQPDKPSQSSKPNQPIAQQKPQTTPPPIPTPELTATGMPKRSPKEQAASQVPYVGPYRMGTKVKVDKPVLQKATIKPELQATPVGIKPVKKTVGK